MKFNPHLHVLTNSGVRFSSKFDRLWRKTVLDNLGVGSNRYYYGFYLHYNLIKSGKIAKYIARYVRHPAISNSRIKRYCANKVVFFHTSNKRKICTEKTINCFISCLVQHIPPIQFKLIRYYGVYCANSKLFSENPTIE